MDKCKLIFILDPEFVSKTKTIVNRIAGLNIVSNKLYMGQIFSRLEWLYEYDFNFCPKTFVMPEDHEALKSHSKKNKAPIYIVKPGFGSEGNGIFLAKGAGNISQFTWESNYLVQEYLGSPYLIPGDSWKFDLWVYVLVTKINPLTAYIA